MKIVFFSDKTSAKASDILRQMSNAGIPIEAIIIDVGRQRSAKKVRTTIRRMGAVEATKFVYRKLRKRLRRQTRSEWQSNDFYRSHSSTVHFVDNFNGVANERVLKEIAPDIIVLGACSRIISNNIINIPSIGILNAHPGLLPRYRGNDIILWAIHHGDPVGVAVHYLDQGVDTGNILVQATIIVEEGDTFGGVKKKAFRLCGEVMATTILRLIEEGHVPGEPQNMADGQLFHRMPISLRNDTERKLSSLEYHRSLAAKSGGR